jgi:hypothetical protein
VTSYVIARTLGDATASTSHKSSFAAQLVPPKSDSKIANAVNSTGPPTVLGADPDPDRDPIPIPLAVSPQEDESPTGISTKPATPASTAAAPGTDTGSGATSSRAFFVDGEEDDGAARLAGVGVFSPVASMPGSPTVSRGDFFEKDGEDGGGGSGSSVASGTDESGSPFVALRGVLLRSSGGMRHQHHHQQHQHQHQHHQGGREAETEQEQEQEPEYGHEHEHENSPRSASDGGGANGAGSTSGESSFAILDREESFEDAGVHIRRRVPGGAGADE